MAVQFFRKATKSILVMLNVLAAALLLVSVYSGRFESEKLWIGGLFSLVSFHLMVVNLLFFIFWIFAKRWISLLSLITMLLCWIPFQKVFKFRYDVSFNMKKSRSTIRVMSWNVEHFDIVEHKTHPEVKSDMISLINEYEPDVACFQEMVAGDDPSQKPINALSDFSRKLKMPYHHYSYIERLDFDNDHHFGIIIFSKYPIINKQTVITKPNSYNSTFQYADIVRNDDTFRIFNFHLQTLRFSPENRSYLNDPSMNDEGDISESKNIIRKFQKGWLTHHLQSNNIKNEIAKSLYPVIVCGDLNDVPNSYAYLTLGKDLRNAFEEMGSGIGNTYDGISSTLRIDNIFMDNRFSVKQYIRIKKKLSDHFPIIADLSYSP